MAQRVSSSSANDASDENHLSDVSVPSKPSCLKRKSADEWTTSETKVSRFSGPELTVKPPEFKGFMTGNGERIQITEEAIEKAKRILALTDRELMPPPPPHPPKLIKVPDFEHEMEIVLDVEHNLTDEEEAALAIADFDDDEKLGGYWRDE